ncbi:MAG: LysR family transcriptional regulator [Smithellaceae bacterium]|jgi:molybdate transport system regulatory protein|nr:LysR family transcriptional regulator [Smithellaceae bacterium]MDD3259256.1 LysR family transcriptional regulator [Smithellaceae bacterium]MDD3848308.1 LysR family transcriptional regulator [Smithellaceae bacterium]HOQ72633.1 LysR family transcriptional regulator [Smithellaceae bacterium]HPL10132.1 LysR family transcriptional regulator [Smithellaceae bacterium]
MEIKYKVWIEKNGKVVFGKGRDDILKAIDEQRSLNAAAKKLEMSYRAAWGRLKASEERMGMKLVEIGVHDKSMQLTGQARSIIERFERLEKDVERLLHTADQDFQKLLQEEGKTGKTVGS